MWNTSNIDIFLSKIDPKKKSLVDHSLRSSRFLSEPFSGGAHIERASEKRASEGARLG